MLWRRSNSLKISLSHPKEMIQVKNPALLQSSLVNLKRLHHFELNSTIKVQEMRSLISLRLNFESATDIDDQSIHKLAHAISRLSNLKHFQMSLTNTSVDLSAQALGFLGQKINNLKQLTEIQLGFPNCAWMTDQKIISLCQSIFKLQNLSLFELDLSYCFQLTDRALCWFGENLPRILTLKSLNFYFLDVFNISYYGINVYWAGISHLKKLKSLQVDFLRCTNIEPKALVSISQALSNLPKLEKLNLYFGIWMKLNDHGVEQLSQTISSLLALKELDLEFVNCPLSDSSTTSLARSISKLSLRKLRLCLLGCKGVTDDTFIELGKCLSKQAELESLYLHFLCHEATGFGFINLTQNIGTRKTLDTLHLEFTHFNEINDLGMYSFGSSLLSLEKIKNLSISFDKSRRLSDEFLQILGDHVGKMKTLESLNVCLGSLPITDEGVIRFAKSLSKAPVLKKLEIDIIKCYITIRGKAAIKACKNYLKQREMNHWNC